MASPPLSPPAPAAGDVIGPYVLEQQLGRGGMGAVWRARHNGTGRAVALKLIISRYAGVADVADRFRREARVLGRLQHPYIVDVSDFGADKGQLYLVMELLGGRSLRDELDERKTLPLVAVVDIVDQVAAALEHAHGQGVVHRDLKPENIQLVPAGDGRVVVRVVDFGIARLGDERDETTTPLPPTAQTEPGLPPSQQHTGSTPLTAHGAILGTAPYMAPEQVFSQPVSAATDVYALACLTWECLTGHTPRTGNLNQILVGHLERKAPALDDERVDANVRLLLRQALDADPALRPGVRNFAGQLRAIAAGAEAVYEAALAQPVDRKLLLVAALLALPVPVVGVALAVVWTTVVPALPAPLHFLAMLVCLVALPSWCMGGALAVIRDRLPWRRLFRGPVLAQASALPPSLRGVWRALAGRFALTVLAGALAAVALVLVAVILGSLEAQLAGTDGGDLLTLGVLTVVGVLLVLLVLTSTRQVAAARLLRAVQEGHAPLAVPRQRSFATAKVAVVVLAGWAGLAALQRPLAFRALKAGEAGVGVASFALASGHLGVGDDFDPVDLYIRSSQQDDASFVEVLIDRAGRGDETPALWSAVAAGRPNVVTVLCQHTVDVRRRDASGEAVLSIAARAPKETRASVVHRLLRKDPGAADVADADGVTPRQRLLATGDAAVAQALTQRAPPLPPTR